MGPFEDLADGTAGTAFAIAKNFPIKTREIPKLPRRSTVPTPAEDATNWKAPLFGPHRPPGKWKITGERSRRIDQPEKKGKNNDALIDQGIARGEVNFEVETYTGQQFRDLQDFYEQYLSPDRPLTKANVTVIAYPALYIRGVKAVYGFKASFPVPRSDKGDAPMVSSFTAKVFNPGTRIGGSGSGSRKPKPPNGTNTNVSSSNLEDLVTLARIGNVALGFVLPGVPDPFLQSSTPEAVQLLKNLGINVDVLAPVTGEPLPPMIIPFKEQASLATITKSVPDQMVVDIANARAPR